MSYMTQGFAGWCTGRMGYFVFFFPFVSAAHRRLPFQALKPPPVRGKQNIGSPLKVSPDLLLARCAAPRLSGFAWAGRQAATVAARNNRKGNQPMSDNPIISPDDVPDCFIYKPRPQGRRIVWLLCGTAYLHVDLEAFLRIVMRQSKRTHLYLVNRKRIPFNAAPRIIYRRSCLR